MQRSRANGSESASAVIPLAPDQQSLLTIAEVAELLRVPPSWVYGHTRRRALDRIPAFKLGKYWRFREADVLAWIERQRVGSRANA